MVNMKKIITNLIAILLCVCVGTAFSFSTGIEDVSAVSKPAKVKTLSASASSYNAANLSWGKAKGASGYQVVRNGSEVCKTTARSYTNGGLKASTAYSYKVRAYKTYKQKQYFNKKTGKWQKKRPKKKYRGGTKKVTLYKYGAYSPVRTIRTKAAPVTPTPTPAPNEPATPSVPGENDTAETTAQAPDVTVEVPKETTATAPAVTNADDPEKIKPTSAKATDPTGINVPDIQNLTVKVTSKNVQLSWSVQSGVTGYQIFRAENSTDTPELIFNSTEAKYCDINEIHTGTTYYYQVRAFKTVNNATYYGNKTDVASATVPASSADNKHIFITDTGITLSWDAPTLSDTEKRNLIESEIAKYVSNNYPDYNGGWEITPQGAYKYNIVRDNSLIKSGTLDTSYVDKDVTDGNTYSYKIKKVLKFTAQSTETYKGSNITISGNDGSVVVCVETYSNIYYEKGTEGFSNSQVEESQIKLAPPTGFAAIGNYNNVALSWNVNEEATGYKIYRNGNLVGTINKNTTCSYKDEGLTPETSYNYTIKSTTAKGGTTANASALTIKTPAKPSFLPPANFKASATYNSVDLTWTTNASVDKYKVYRNRICGYWSFTKNYLYIFRIISS